ncbi:hypothetical protein N0V88_001947 [Collariella sp. IMI 366227]|nr:hypothetical protein N0V88_001947 [Collariella sp. IMI 366227]
MFLPLPHLILLSTTLLTLWLTNIIISSVLSLLKNRRLAIASGLPYVLVPYFEINIVCGILARTPLFPLVADRLLPERWTRWKRFVRPDWRFRGGYEKTHGEKGDVLLVVSPGGIVCNIADAGVAFEVLQARGKFVKMQRVLITVPPFSETTNRQVWDNALEQAEALLKLWASRQPTFAKQLEVVSIEADLRSLTMSVFSTVGFGVRVILGQQASKSEEAALPTTATTEHEGMKFVDALERLGNNFRLAIMAKILPHWYIKTLAPASLKKMYSAYLSFGKHLQDMIFFEERKRKEDTHGATNGDGALARRNRSLLASLIHERHIPKTKQGEDESLTDEDIMGNLWIFGVAGHETTSNTLEYLVVAMAIYKDAQQWLCGELDRAVAEHGPVSGWEYDRMPELTAVLCCMHETMRLFPVQPVILRWVDNKTQTIRTQEDRAAHILPPETVVDVNCVALHRNPKYWGSEADQFRPQRWDGRANRDDGPQAPKRRYATVKSPKVPGAFMPFGEGVRACLGRKFAEVETAAVVTTLFSEHNVGIALMDGESEAEAIERAKRIVAGSSNQMAMAIRRDIKLVWTRRGL